MLAALGVATLMIIAPAGASADSDVFALTVGLRGGGGAELSLAPSGTQIPSAEQNNPFTSPLFDGTRAGYGYQVGWFAELRFLKHLGLEIGFGYNRRFLIEETDWEFRARFAGASILEEVYQAKSRQEISWAGINVPVLVKGILPVQNARIWLGVGPEWFIGQWSAGKVERTTDVSNQPPNDSFPDFVAPIRQLERVQARTVSDTYITWALGVDIVAGGVVIPIAFKFGWNATHPSGYQDRLAFERDDPNQPLFPNGQSHPESVTVRAADSLYGQFLIGIAYDVL